MHDGGGGEVDGPVGFIKVFFDLGDHNQIFSMTLDQGVGEEALPLKFSQILVEKLPTFAVIDKDDQRALFAQCFYAESSDHIEFLLGRFLGKEHNFSHLDLAYRPHRRREI